MRQSLRQAIMSARSHSRCTAAKLGHRLGRFVNAPFVATAPRFEYRSGAGCERCPARVRLDAVSIGSNARAWRTNTSGDALSTPCTGVTRFTVDAAATGVPQTVGFTASRSEAYITRQARAYAIAYAGRTVNVVRPSAVAHQEA